MSDSIGTPRGSSSPQRWDGTSAGAPPTRTATSRPCPPPGRSAPQDPTRLGGDPGEELVARTRVDHLAGPDPPPPGHVDAIGHEVELGDAVRVRRDDPPAPHVPPP